MIEAARRGRDKNGVLQCVMVSQLGHSLNVVTSSSRGSSNLRYNIITTKSIGNLEKGKFASIISHQFYAPSLNHAGARPQSGMLSLRRGGMVIRRQIPTKSIPNQPD